MKKFISLLAVSLFLNIFCFGQNGQVNGNVKDNSNQPIPYATVQIMKSGGSAIIKATVSGNNGSFQISKIDNGNYIIDISSIGFEKQSTLFTVDSAHEIINLPDFTLIAAKNILEGITVSTGKKFIEVKADKT
ncbi:MAG: carboxypeptidase-like regulatory domain-containing protein, partial [Ginsengibacter sp.]